MLLRKNSKDKPKRTMTADADRKVCLKIEITNNEQPKICPANKEVIGSLFSHFSLVLFANCYNLPI